MTFSVLGQVLANVVVTHGTRDFKIPAAREGEEYAEPFVIVWSYHSGLITADSYRYTKGNLFAWDGQDWRPVAQTQAYNPQEPNLNATVIAVFTKD